MRIREKEMNSTVCGWWPKKLDMTNFSYPTTFIQIVTSGGTKTHLKSNPFQSTKDTNLTLLNFKNPLICEIKRFLNFDFIEIIKKSQKL